MSKSARAIAAELLEDARQVVLAPDRCPFCHDSGIVYAWFLIEGQWVETLGPCSCLDEQRC